eukprot:7904127-Lingulodinium_polyedra.AAC.1
MLASVALLPGRAGQRQDQPAGPLLTVPGAKLCLQELCAGHAGVAAVWRAARGAAEEPVEFYADPEAC